MNTSSTNGDTVEIYNTGPGAVDLTGYILSDLDPAAVETTITAEGTFAPPSLNLPVLAAGRFAVVLFTNYPALRDDELWSADHRAADESALADERAAGARYSSRVAGRFAGLVQLCNGDGY